jgi:integrase/recombinase XerC
MRRFARFLERGVGVELLADVSTPHVVAFVNATTKSGRPSVATTRLRRWSIRLFFRTARELGLTTADPTVDVVLPPRPNRTARPLSTAQVECCRIASLHDLSSTRLSVAWALGEASARTAEIPHLQIRDVDFERARVWIHGSPQTTPRFGVLSSWGVVQLDRRVRELGRQVHRHAPIAHIGTGNPESRVSFSAQALRETLTRAGLARVPGIHPASLAGWSGVQVFKATGRIDVVANALGVRSLDAAARVIGWEWRNTGKTPANG